MKIEQLMGIVPLGVGLLVLGWVWTQPYSGFGAMPLFFRLFFSFIAGGFVLTGLGVVSGAITQKDRLKSMLKDLHDIQREFGVKSNAPQQPGGGYQCTNCGAGLPAQADVSPSGDVKCAHCGQWFNIHHR